MENCHSEIVNEVNKILKDGEYVLICDETSNYYTIIDIVKNSYCLIDDDKVYKLVLEKLLEKKVQKFSNMLEYRNWRNTT